MSLQSIDSQYQKIRKQETTRYVHRNNNKYIRYKKKNIKRNKIKKKMNFLLS